MWKYTLKYKLRRHRTAWGIIAFILLAAALFSLTYQPLPALPGALTVHFIDVGEADCTLLLCDGHSMLIDGGNPADGQSVLDFLRAQDVRRLDYVVGTHPHADHVGGLCKVLAEMPADVAFCALPDEMQTHYPRFVEAAEAAGLRLQPLAPGESWMLGGARVTVLGPLQHYDELNNRSLVLRVDYGDTSLIVCGDAQTDAEQAMLASGLPLRADLLRLGHHGSSDASSAAWLDAVRPETAVISCGAENDWGHPHAPVLARLAERGIAALRTDLHGSLTAFSDGTRFTFYPVQNP